MKWVAGILIGLVILTVTPVVALRWVDPPTSAFMLQHKLHSLWNPRSSGRIMYRWEKWRRISPHAPLAVVAAEDQKFPYHWGFDRESIAEAWDQRRKGERFRGASTITQQVAKNLFLWNGKSFVRKGFEAYFAVMIELLWSKRRILEIYLNIAEFGEGVYGIGAASRKYFYKTPRRLRRYECALLATVLPNPKRMRLDRPSDYMVRRAASILDEMNRLDRIQSQSYLRPLYAR
jgi:monofunctional biosynthetic peptidoglycan transglycosylase